MKAVNVHMEVDKPVLIWEDMPEPSFGPDEVLVNVRATAVNRADLAQAAGKYPPPPGESEILGLEMAGEIAAIGENVTGWQIGDRVFALLQGGGYAEQVAVPHQLLMRLPDKWPFEQGAAIPEVWLTAFSNLFYEGKLTADKTALIHAGASGVGSACIQLCRAIGAKVIVTVGSDEKAVWCQNLGASLAINYKTEDFSEIIKKSEFRGVDMILDPVGGTYLKQNVRILRPYGTLINIGIMGGRWGELDMGMLLMKSLKLAGSRLRARSLENRIQITREFEARFLPMMQQDELHPVIDRILSITRANEAHDIVASNRTMGKIILTIP